MKVQSPDSVSVHCWNPYSHGDEKGRNVFASSQEILNVIVNLILIEIDTDEFFCFSVTANESGTFDFWANGNANDIFGSVSVNESANESANENENGSGVFATENDENVGVIVTAKMNVTNLRWRNENVLSGVSRIFYWMKSVFDLGRMI